jgi:hypothetical protein
MLSFVSCGSQGKGPADASRSDQITDKDRDGTVLFNLSMADAKRETLPDSIKVYSTGEKRFYVFFEHKLSCGTLMTGVVSESQEGDKIRQSAAFTILKNPYKITAMEYDATFSPKNAVMSLSGIMEVDDVKIKLAGPELILN